MYNDVFKTAPNTTVLGAVTCINSNFISVLREKYNPHVVIIDTDIHCKNTSVNQLLNDILRYSYMKTIVITGADDRYDYPATKVIRGQITNIALKDALSQLSSTSIDNSQECDDKEKSFVDNSPMKSKSQRSVKLTAKKKLNPVIIAVISAIILAGTVIAAVIVKNSNSNNNDNDNSISTVDEAPSFSINNTCDTVAVTSVSPSTAAKSRDRTQSVVGSYDKSKSKIHESDNTAKSSENKSDKSDNKSKSNNINDDDNTDAYTKNDNQKNDSYNNDDNNYKEYGSAVISYESNGYQNSHSDEVSSIKLNYNSKTLRIGDTLTISAYVSPSSAPQGVSWSSSNTNVVSVNMNGKLTAHHNGVADITATAENGKSATCRVTVSGSSYDNNVRLSVTSYNLSVGESLTVTLYNSSNCQWSYSESVVKKLNTSNNSITICGRKRGNTDLTAINKNTGIKYICKINVR